MKVLVTDPLGEKGLSVLKSAGSFTVDEKVGATPEELKKIITNLDI